MIMNKKELFRLYILASLAFTMALVKYLFEDKYYIFEILSFILFLAIIYFGDKLIRLRTIEKIQFDREKDEINSSYEEKINQLNSTIEQLTKEQSERLILDNEIEIIGDKIKDSINKIQHQDELANQLLIQFSKYYEIGLGICYLLSEHSEKLCVKGVYGIIDDDVPTDLEIADGLHGQSISDKKPILIQEIDENYFNIESCLGSSKPKHLYLLPITKNEIVIGLIELATFKIINIEKHWQIINDKIANVLIS